MLEFQLVASSQQLKFGKVFFVLINIANQRRKNLPDLICQNTYGYRVKSVLLRFILDAKKCAGEDLKSS